MKFINANGRFTKDSSESAEERKIAELVGKEEEVEVEYEWIPLSIRRDEIVAYNAYDEYSTAIRLANTQVFVVDLLYGEVMFLTLPRFKRFFYRNLEIARERLISLKMRVKRFKNNFVF